MIKVYHPGEQPLPYNASLMCDISLDMVSHLAERAESEDCTVDDVLRSLIVEDMLGLNEAEEPISAHLPQTHLPALPK